MLMLSYFQYFIPNTARSNLSKSGFKKKKSVLVKDANTENGDQTHEPTAVQDVEDCPEMVPDHRAP